MYSFAYVSLHESGCTWPSGSQSSWALALLAKTSITRIVIIGCTPLFLPDSHIYIYTAHTPAHTPIFEVGFILGSSWDHTNRAWRIPSAHTRRMPSRSVFWHWVATGLFGPGAYLRRTPPKYRRIPPGAHPCLGRKIHIV